MKLVVDYRSNYAQMFRDLAELAHNERMRRVWMHSYQRMTYAGRGAHGPR